MAFQDSDFINTFFSLLRSGLYGTPLPESELPRSIDWEAVYAFAHKHAVLGIIIDSAQYLPDTLRPAGAVAARMNKFALGLIQANLVMDQTAARVVSFFRQHGIHGVLIKGQGVARYYRVPQMRQCGDIDYYIGKTVYKRAVALCNEYLIVGKNPCEETEQHFDFFLDGIPIELHRLATKVYIPFRNKRFQQWIVEQLEHSPDRCTLTVGDTDITLPSYDFDAIYIFYHAWRHFIMGGVGLRQLSDWTMLFHTHASDIDTARLVDNIRRFGMTEGWKLFACIAVNHLGARPDAIPLYDPAYTPRSRKILDEILSGGNFGFYTKEYARTKGSVAGLRYGLNKVRNCTKYFISLFPVIPLEATFLYFNRLFYGTIACTRRTIRKMNE